MNEKLNGPDYNEIYSDPEQYDAKYAELVDDIDNAIRLAERYGGPVLEVACGTGRITIPLVKAGFEVVGLDLSPEMMGHGKSKAKEAGVSIEWVEGDLRDFDLGRRFNTIIFPFNSLGHLHTLEDLEAFMRCAKAHLTDEGRLVIDYFNPDPNYFIRDPEEVQVQVEFPDAYGRGTVKVMERIHYDRARQINNVDWSFEIEGESVLTDSFGMRTYYPLELDALIKYNGFEIEEKYGDYDQGDFTSDSPKQVIVCRPRR